MNDLGAISRIFKNHQVVSIQADGAMFFMLVEQILHDVNDTEVSMMTPFGE